MRWLHKYDVNKFVLNAQSPDQFKEVAKKIHDTLVGKAGFEGFNLGRLLEVESAEEFDEVWEELYDYADTNRIWLGL